MDWQQESTNVSEELRVKEYGKDWTLDKRTRESRIETSGFWTSSVPHQENTRAGSHALLRSCPTKVRVGINDDELTRESMSVVSCLIASALGFAEDQSIIDHSSLIAEARICAPKTALQRYCAVFVITEERPARAIAARSRNTQAIASYEREYYYKVVEEDDQSLSRQRHLDDHHPVLVSSACWGER
ncbi:hypothetical protein E4U43_006430 [Claviceps pusilla]|uniref:Uncharacterized protein n=1 Tax=Claviceps pusilla TaxID=123648 RepID=A0A9P7N3D0_9HYPO|nr:hypothetical protein E4U43_006430 [Claviceps pusilla]